MRSDGIAAPIRKFLNRIKTSDYSKRCLGHREGRTEDEEKRTSADGILRTNLRNKSNILNKLEVLFRSSEFCFFDHLKTEDI